MIFKHILILALIFTFLFSVKCCKLFENEKEIIHCESLEDLVASGNQPDWKKLVITNPRKLEKKSLEKDIFINVPNLEYLMIENLINKIEPTVFKQVPKLRYLQLINNTIEYLPDKIFDGLALNTLYITNSNLKNIKPGTLDKIEIVNLEGNQINPGTLFKNTNISFIDLSNNSISNIEDCAFCGMKNLKIIKLFSNSLTSFDPVRIFGKRSSVEGIGLDGNKLTKISKFDNAVNLTGLSIANNFIEDIEDKSFANCPKFQLLEVSNNNLKEIPANIFPDYKDDDEPIFLIINGNKIQCLSEELRNKVNKLRKVTVNDNSWQCDCLNDVISWAKTKNAFVGCELPIRPCIVPCTDKNRKTQTITLTSYL